GEVHARTAREVVDAFGLQIPVFGMVKDDRHRTRALVTPTGEEIGIAAAPAVFAFVGRIQEETHRFAITFHRESHRKSTLQSELDKVPGIGPKRREALRKRFGSMKAIRAADVEALSEVVPKEVAETLWRAFHETKGE
ncbi:MAG: excinuclease ABC subunit UvrC, partial [Oscillibacter sp.]|nr:excinuclease ABC subunit UvrC [Oscillibacter sp.]